MTRLWLIFFSGCCILACAGLRVVTTNGATVAGRVEVTSLHSRADAAEQGLSDVVIWLEPVHPGADETLRVQHVQLVQKDKMFRPHTLVVDVGSVVDFPNKDPIYHNAFSNFDGQLFDVGLYPPGGNRSVRMHRAGIVRVFCNIHPSMSAVIVVLDTPYFTKAGRDGRYRITGVVEGSYRLRVFDERATDTTDAADVVTVEGDSAEITVPPLHLSEAGYVRPPHKNKYGFEYPPGADNADIYRGPER
jgi:plastocyanin